MDAIVKQNSAFITSELARMDGFSRIALSLFYVDDTAAPKDADGNVAFAKLDPTTFPTDEASCVADTSSMFLIDLDAADATKARVTCRALYHQDFKLSNSRSLAAVGPASGVVLAPAHHYAAVLTSRVKTADGKPVQASADFAKVQQGASDAPALYVKAYKTVTADLGSALSKDGATVVALAPYTTHDMARQMYAVRDGIEAAAAPPLTWDSASMAPMSPALFAAPVAGALPAGATASLDDWLGVVAASAKLPDGTDDPDGSLPVRAHDQIAAVGTGVFEATNWLTHYQGANYTVAGTADVHAPTAAATSSPRPTRRRTRSGSASPCRRRAMPSSGYPLVIFQHGLGGSRDDFLAIANPLCKQGWMVRRDRQHHVRRRARPRPAYQVDKMSDFSGSPGAKYTGPDGFADAVGSRVAQRQPRPLRHAARPRRGARPVPPGASSTRRSS